MECIISEKFVKKMARNWRILTLRSLMSWKIGQLDLNYVSRVLTLGESPKKYKRIDKKKHFSAGFELASSERKIFDLRPYRLSYCHLFQNVGL